jgi:hypothetical protein
MHSENEQINFDKASIIELLQKHKVDELLIAEIQELLQKQEEAELLKLVIEYYKLSSLTHLDKEHEDRILDILNLAIVDEELSEWIDKVDASIAKYQEPSDTNWDLRSKEFLDKLKQRDILS